MGMASSSTLSLESLWGAFTPIANPILVWVQAEQQGTWQGVPMVRGTNNTLFP